MKALLTLAMAALLLLLGTAYMGCDESNPQASNDGELEPLQMYFVPSNEVEAITTSADALQEALSKALGRPVRYEIPTGYAAVVEAFGSGDADFAFMPTFAYSTAYQRYGASAGLITVRHGSTTYQAEIVVRADSGITSMADLNGKTWAYPDPNSTSGRIVPERMLALAGVAPGEEIHAGGHPQTVDMVYSGRADFGTCFYSPPDQDGNIKDARMYLLEQYPDIEQQVIILQRSMPIPNDCVCFRQDLDPALRQQICDALVAFSETEEGRVALDELASVDAYQPVDDAFYAEFRRWAQQSESGD